ncbi:NAD(P)H-dependent flavin oxidoreductase YrpB (nitropropane dioxygenase family) [Rhizobium mongolense]
MHENIKNAIVSATERDTRLIMRGLRNTERVLTNRAVEQVLEKEAELGSAVSFQDIPSLVTGVYARVMRRGEVDAGPWSCGMVVGCARPYQSYHAAGGGNHQSPLLRLPSNGRGMSKWVPV